jgi:hypothetical protein
MPFDAPAFADVIETVIKTALAPLVARIKTLETHTTADLVRVEGYTSFLQRDLSAAMERIASLEAVPTQPGPQGPPGLDGLGFDAYTVDYDGERTFTHRWQAGEKAAEMTFRTPIAIYRGVYLDGKVYERGDLVTLRGSVYHCDTDTTTRPGDGKDWTLAVKSGKDSKAPWPR